MKIKKMMVALLSAAILFIPTKVYGEEKVNRFDDWKKTAIISPESAELKAAGPIKVEFNKLVMDKINIDHYDLYLDGSKEPVDVVKGEDDILIGEVYTTKVAVHTLQVVAVTDKDYEISSNARKFLVSKKGLNVDDKAVKNLIEDMNESWYYNWGTEESNYVSGNKEFVPMIWGKYTMDWLQSKEIHDYSTILGFNEPDFKNQSNLSVDEVAKYQDQFTATGLRVGSPATVNPTNDWFQTYSKTVNMDDIDFIAVHIYYDYAGGTMADTFLKAIDATYEKYHKPIWVTEYGVNNNGLYGTNYSDESLKDIEQYMKDTIQGLEERDYVERYTWFNYGLDSEVGGKTALYDQKSGELTDLGKLYASLGNPDINDIDLKDEYIEDDAYYEDLDDMIGKVNEVINDSRYENQISEELIAALNNAKSVNRYLGSDSQYVVDQLTEDLNNEYKKIEILEDQISIAVLKSEYDDASKLNETSYTQTSWKVFKEALNSAKNVLEKENANSFEVAGAYNSLMLAKAGLVKAGDKSILQEKYDEASQLIKEDFTLESWVTFDEALNSAKKVLDNKDAIQDDVDKALTLLEKSKVELVKKKEITSSNKDNDTSSDTNAGDNSVENETNKDESIEKDTSSQVITGDDAQIIAYLSFTIISFLGILFLRRKLCDSICE